MNLDQRERMQTVRDHINFIPKFEMNDDGYPKLEDAVTWKQGSWIKQELVNQQGHSCGTAACFAGWAAILFGTPEQVKGMHGADGANPHEIGKEILGLTESQAVQLFEGRNSLETVNEYVDSILSKNTDS